MPVKFGYLDLYYATFWMFFMKLSMAEAKDVDKGPSSAAQLVNKIKIIKMIALIYY